MLEALRMTEAGAVIALDAATGQQVLTEILRIATEAENQDLRPVLVCSPQIRAGVRRMVQPYMERLPVLSYSELISTANVRSVGVVSADQTLAVNVCKLGRASCRERVCPLVWLSVCA